MNERFWSAVDKRGPDECWPWRKHHNNCGYPRFVVNRRNLGAHRIAYELMVGPIPEGLQIDHLCRNRGCVNPAHMEPVTPRTNTLRGNGAGAYRKAQTHCIHGHPLSGDNLRTRPDGRRQCIACDRRAVREWRARQK